MTNTIVPPTPWCPPHPPNTLKDPPQDGTKGVGGSVVVGIGALGIDMTQTTCLRPHASDHMPQTTCLRPHDPDQVPQPTRSKIHGLDYMIQTA